MILSVAQIDTELAARGREVDAITATLLELDKHPGLTLVRGYPPTGVTATRWEPVRQMLDLMWEDFGRLQSILEQARAVRARRNKLTDTDRTELTRLLRERPYEVSRIPIPLGQRSLTGPNEQVLFVGIAETLDRMRTTFPTIADFLDAVDAINSRVLSGLTPIQAQLDQCGADITAGRGADITVGRAGSTAELRAIADGVADLLSRSATDPLALTPADIDTRIAALADRLRRQAEALAELWALVADWPAAIADTRSRIDELRAIQDRAAGVRGEAQRKIRTAPLPVHPDRSPALYAESAALATGPATTGTDAAMALLELRRRIAVAIDAARADLQLAQGLLDRQAELRGRLAAYQAKAARLGVSEDQEVLSANRIAAGLLSGRPCDLAAVTRAIVDYRQVITEKSGRRG
jgi:hypothetical protein